MTTALPRWPPVDVWGAPPAGPQGDLGWRLAAPPGGTPGKAHGGPAPMPAGGAEPVSGLPAGPSPPPPLRPRLPESRAHGQERRRHGDLLPEALGTHQASHRVGTQDSGHSKTGAPSPRWVRRACDQRARLANRGSQSWPLCPGEVTCQGISLPTCSRPSDQRNLLVFGRSKNQHLLMVR